MTVENEFIDWFKNNQGVFYDNLSEIKSINGMGRSLVAKSDIAVCFMCIVIYVILRIVYLIE